MNPIKVLIANAGKFLYVLNAGCGGTVADCLSGGTTANHTGANISLFTIGGQGGLSFQAAYTSQGNNPISIQTDLPAPIYSCSIRPSRIPPPAWAMCRECATICGDITAFNIDPNTGRLSLITNQGVKNPGTGTNLSYFP